MSAPTVGTGPDVRLHHEDEYRFRVRFSRGAPGLVADLPLPLGDAAGPDPVELLAAAIGHCLASSFLFCLRKARIDPEGLEVEVQVEKVRDESNHLRVGRVRVALAPTLGAEDRRRLGRCLDLFESFCVVTESVRRGIPVDVLVEPAAAGQEVGQACPPAA